jgi:hypothetical protein
MENTMTETEPTDTTNRGRGAPASPSPELTAFGKLVSQEAEAFALFNSAEDAHDRKAITGAEASQREAHKQIVALTDAICAAPVNSLADVIERAEIARYWQHKRLTVPCRASLRNMPAIGSTRI